ncbi:MAG: hypothetical protein J6Q35_01485, partial [Rikenellaceae bacterium]|nr:hypothetical protein [Rikenellaceae bacterium]
GMKAKVEAEFEPAGMPFAEYKDYHFNDDSKEFYGQRIEIVSSQLDSEGRLRFVKNIEGLEQAPGMLSAKVTARVFEPSGNFSTDVFNVKCAPFERFVGMRLPESDSEMFVETECEHKFDLIMVDYKGKKIDDGEVEVEIHKMDWEWWWNVSDGNRAYFMRNSIDRTVMTQKVKIKNGKGQFEYKWGNVDWGLYAIRVRDLQGGHSTAKLVRVDWADSPHSTGDTDEATLLTITTDKERYRVGECAKISFPSAKGARALVTVESSAGVLEAKWVDCEDITTVAEIVTNEKMLPNVYVWVSLIQPYGRLKNDAPIRLYGVIPLLVDDVTTQLEPKVKAPQEVRPEQQYTIEVSEKNGTPMSYTLAIVDEGLLDLTRFATPNPWNKFYAREALGIRTWDMYNDVIGAYGGSIEQLFSVGGDDEIISRGDIKAQRFTPVVKFLGPFELAPNQTAKHSVVLPNYVGAVRTMVVASHKGRAFGSAETRSFVRKPLMTLMTLPRTVATDDVVEIPVTVFAMQDNVGDVKVELLGLKGFAVVGNSTEQISFKKEGEQTVVFKVKASSVPAFGSVSVKCSSADDSATDKVEINIQDSNVKSRVRTMAVIAPNSRFDSTFRLAGRKGTNSLSFSLSTLLAVDISGRLAELTEYPHGCLEQIVSGAFPQLYLNKVTNLNEDEQRRVQSNVNSVLNKLLKYRRQDGSLSYWPGENRVNKWASIWAGHFMVEAQNMGYALPIGLFERWLDYEKAIAKTWRAQDGAQESQAYRLWVLALAGESDRGAMNRLRENTSLTPLSKRLLAGAYAADGRKDLSRTLLESAQQMEPKNSASECFGSAERDLAIEAVIYKGVGNQTQAYQMARQLAESLCSDRWLSTQSAAWALMAVAQIVEPSEDDSSLDVDYVVANRANKLISTSPIEKVDIDAKALEGDVKVQICNNNSHTIYLTMESVGVPIRGEEQEVMNNLSVRVDYLDENGVKLDVSQLKLGKDFRVRITITPTATALNYENIALTQVFPSGWEIRSDGSKQLDGRVEYRDVRDDRIMVYFNLNDSRPLEIETRLSATYAGEFYLPGVVVESMYNGDISARTKGENISVKR